VQKEMIFIQTNEINNFKNIIEKEKLKRSKITKNFEDLKLE
jgi:hypothetical protein